MTNKFIHTVTLDGEKFSRTSPRLYTHVVVGRTPTRGNKLAALQWSMSEANARKGLSAMLARAAKYQPGFYTDAAVLPVTERIPARPL